MLQGFRKGIEDGVNGACPVNDTVFLILDTQADSVSYRPENAQFVCPAVFRIQRQRMFMLAVKIRTAGGKARVRKPIRV